MYDPATSALIRSSPELPDLDCESLPDELSRAFAEIVSARVMLRDGDDDSAALNKTIAFARRLAQTNEALVAINPERENRAGPVSSPRQPISWSIKPPLCVYPNARKPF